MTANEMEKMLLDFTNDFDFWNEVADYLKSRNFPQATTMSDADFMIVGWLIIQDIMAEMEQERAVAVNG
jgi:hypothetical protein